MKGVNCLYEIEKLTNREIVRIDPHLDNFIQMLVNMSQNSDNFTAN